MVLENQIVEAIKIVKENPIYVFLVNPVYANYSSDKYCKEHFVNGEKYWHEEDKKVWDKYIMPFAGNKDPKLILETYRDVFNYLQRENNRFTKLNGGLIYEFKRKTTVQVQKWLSKETVAKKKIIIEKEKIDSALLTSYFELMTNLQAMIKYIQKRPFYWWVYNQNEKVTKIYKKERDKMRKDKDKTYSHFLNNIKELFNYIDKGNDNDKAIYEKLCSLGALGQAGGDIERDRKEVQEILAEFLSSSNKVMNCEVTPLISRLKF